MNDMISKFMCSMNNLEERDYMFNLITYGIAPTIYGCKSSTLISLTNKYKNTYNLWNSYREQYLSRLPLKCFELSKTEDSFIVLFYDEDNLNSIIKQEDCMAYLKTCGYDYSEDILNCLGRLKERYSSGCPHEIGLFLDIPLKDVLGFIENSGQNFLHCGYWKVYSNIEKALETFEEYNWCKKKVIEFVCRGMNPFEVIEALSRLRKA